MGLAWHAFAPRDARNCGGTTVTSMENYAHDNYNERRLMIPSSPILSSFDPACHLHSEDLPITANPPSESFSDDLEAIHLARADLTRNKVVIQHRAWNLSDVFRSDEDIRLG